ncbi:C1QL [Mytilus coruscus]|uniref:C1QL n=1 Tax=Mytilus coruscus TaxID=42192 RepID=A0A6J7ZVY0_MYTCO|nr:C1QL [Mytilus coruscus]
MFRAILFSCIALTISYVNGKMDGDVIDVKTVYKEMVALQETVQRLYTVVHGQNDRISDLERTINTQEKTIQKLTTDKKTQIEYRRKIERRLKIIENNFAGKYSDLRNNFVKNDNTSPPNGTDKHENTYGNGGLTGSYKEMVKTPAISRKERLLLPSNGITNEPVVAFYAYLSKHEINPSTHHTLIYDVAKTNAGNGYNAVTGIFTAPTAGTYVFTWVTRMYEAGHSTEILVNNVVFGASYLRIGHSNDVSVSGTVVTQINKGNSVFVRVHSTLTGSGNILSEQYGRSSFAGWLLH